MATCDWVFLNKHPPLANPVWINRQKGRERKRNKESNKECEESMYMCIWQWFPPAPLGANGEETLQTFVTEQHAELTTLMAAPVSATSLCSSPLVETYCKMAPNSHSNQTVPNIQVCSVVNLNIWGQQPNLSERSAHLLFKWKSSSPFSVRDLRSGRKFSIYSAKSCHCITEVLGPVCD